ncbi:MAG: type VI secretion system ImpA family N-terminal domain-containing protein [Planctomycetes bacterium]|nr:type VI secretion system ImpA family N-terminal domain-containing protein [Planctomycetota bacterium]
MMTPLGTDPIPGDKRAGAAARYEPEFEELENEISKLNNPAGGEIKWPDVASLARTILSQKSKDLLVASYYAYGQLQLLGLQGLLEGIQTINGMCQTFWEDLFPEARRMRARESALDWLIDRVTSMLEKAPPPGGDEIPVMQQCVAVWDNLTEYVNPKLEAPNPKLPAFSRLLASRVASASPAEESSESAGTTGAGAPTNTVMIAGGAAGPITNRKVAFERLREVADYLKRTEPHSPVAYLVQRAIKWGDMPLESVIAELVKNNDVRKQVYETLGLKQEGAE